MGRDVRRAQLELLERDARHDARAHDAAARRHGMVPVDSPQQRGLAGPVRPVYHPAIPGAHVDLDALQDVRVVDVNIRAMHRDERAALARPASYALLARVKYARVLLQQLARLRRAHAPALLDDTLLELEQMRHRVGNVL